MEPTQNKLVIAKYQEEKGPMQYFCAEILEENEGSVIAALFHPQEKFQTVTLTKVRDHYTTGRDTTVYLIDPSEKEMRSLHRVRDAVLPSLAKDALVIKKPKRKKIEAIPLEFEDGSMPVTKKPTKEVKSKKVVKKAPEKKTAPPKTTKKAVAKQKPEKPTSKPKKSSK